MNHVYNLIVNTKKTKGDCLDRVLKIIIPLEKRYKGQFISAVADHNYYNPNENNIEVTISFLIREEI